MSGLEQSIGFNMGVTYRKLSARFQQRLKEYDITPEQWSVLYVVEQGEGLIQKTIAERSCKDRPTTTRILDHLEGKGLIYKRTGENDRRSFLVAATDRGSELIRLTLPIEQETRSLVRQCMNDEEHDQLLELLRRISHHMDNL